MRRRQGAHGLSGGIKDMRLVSSVPNMEGIDDDEIIIFADRGYKSYLYTFFTNLS